MSIRLRRLTGRQKRWCLWLGERLSFRAELGRVRGLRWAHIGYGGQEDFLQMSAGLGWGIWLAIETPHSWHRLRPRDGKYGESHAEWGVSHSHGTGRLLLGHDPYGTHWGYIEGRFGGLRAAWRNREVTWWRNEWITGRDRHERRVLDVREIVIDCGRWPGDSYVANQEIVRRTNRNRFRTQSWVAYEWDIIEGSHGIPTDANGKWGDRYSETFGFGATAPDTDDVDALLAAQPEALRRRLESLLRDWPEGHIAEYPEPAEPRHD